jgi:hypothetical protein
VAVAGDDEQRVVDGHRQAEHQRQRRGAAAQVDEAGGDLDAGHGRADPEDRGQQRQSGGDQRAEGDHQHDGGDQDAEDLGVAGPALLLRGLSARLHGQAGGPARLCGPEERLTVGVGQCGRLHLVGDLRVRDRPGLVDGALERIADRGHLRAGVQPGDGLRDGVPVRRVGELLTGGRREHHPGLRAVRPGAGEPLLEQVHRLLGLGARDRELVGGRPGQREGADAE